MDLTLRPMPMSPLRTRSVTPRSTWLTWCVGIRNNTVINQDDCVAINNGTNIVISNNSCIDGHGISIGSIRTGDRVNTVLIEGNKILSSQIGMPPLEDAFLRLIWASKVYESRPLPGTTMRPSQMLFTRITQSLTRECISKWYISIIDKIVEVSCTVWLYSKTM